MREWKRSADERGITGEGVEEETRGASQVREWKRSADERGITGEGVEEER